MMAIKLAIFNAKGMRDQSKVACLFCDLLSFRVDISAIQETHFVCNINSCVLSNDFIVYSAYGVNIPPPTRIFGK